VVKPPTAGRTQADGQNGCTVAIWAGIALVVVLAVGKCSSTGTSNVSTSSLEVEQNLTAAVAAQSPPPVEPLNAASLARGIAHLRLAERTEGLSGAMIYSQNCYDALSRHFTWAKLDTCGAFDMMAVGGLAQADVAGFDKEVGYFESETAAGRYLAAAKGAGEDADGTDVRLSQLQGKVSRAAPPVKAAAPPHVEEDAGTEEANGSANDAPPDEDGLDKEPVREPEESNAE
jgi:hypothetical protein